MQPEIKMVKYMNKIDDDITMLPPNKTILFFDIDNTLIRTKTDIGSVEWIKWQEKLFNKYNGQHEFCVTDTLDNLYKLYRLWLINSNCETELLEEYVPELINKYVSLGFKIVLVTARHKSTAKITIDQISRHFIIGQFYSSDIYFENEDILFQNGIYFAGGTNKGKCINKLLQVFKLVFDYKPENIVFIDDSLRECKTIISGVIDADTNIYVFNYLFGIRYQKQFDKLDKNLLHEEWSIYCNSIINNNVL